VIECRDDEVVGSREIEILMRIKKVSFNTKKAKTAQILFLDFFG
jgi:hypothetical protein